MKYGREKPPNPRFSNACVWVTVNGQLRNGQHQAVVHPGELLVIPYADCEGVASTNQVGEGVMRCLRATLLQPSQDEA